MTAGRKLYGHTQKQQEIIAKIKRWRRKKRNRTRSPYTQIARKLNQENIPAPGGGTWTGRSVRTISKRKSYSKTSGSDQVEKRSLHANDYLNKQQLGLCLRACPARDRLIFETLLGTGMRPKIEFCQLQVRDLGVWNGQHQVDVRKGKRKVARGITIDQELAAMLRKFLSNERKGAGLKDPVFLDTRGNSLSYRALRNRLMKLGRKAGVGRLNPYRLRHTFGTVIYKDKKDLFFVAKQMGHKNVQTTQIYVHVSETEKNEQMEAFRRHVKEAENVGK
jgi:integrase